MEVANTLTYYDTATITAIKSFNGFTPGTIILKYFMAVIVAAP